MKRLICALMVALFVGGVLGCKGEDKKPDKKDKPEPKKDKPEPKEE